MRQRLRSHLLFILALCAIIILLTVLDIGCPILYFLRIPCPCCGITRSLISLFCLDIKGYLSHHALSLPLILSVWLVIHAKIFKRRKLMVGCALLVCVLNLVYYVFRLANGAW